MIPQLILHYGYNLFVFQYLTGFCCSKILIVKRFSLVDKIVKVCMWVRTLKNICCKKGKNFSPITLTLLKSMAKGGILKKPQRKPSKKSNRFSTSSFNLPDSTLSDEEVANSSRSSDSSEGDLSGSHYSDIHEEEEFDPNPGLPQSKTVQDFYFKFPETSADPTKWCRTPREVHKVPWQPKRPEGHSELNFHSDMSVGLMFVGMMKAALELVIRETNRYAQMRIKEGQIHYKWDELGVAEFCVWLGVFLCMHASPKPDILDYWYSKGHY